MRFVIAALLCSGLGVASAQTPSPTGDAENLFKEGLALFDAGKVEEACAKFDQSIKKNPRALGTLMNLGRCAERRGKVATALALYQEAFDRASEAGAAGAKDKAQERITVLAAQVPIVVLKRAGAPLPGEKLVVDDKVVPNDKTELPLDPGTHNFVVTAPGRLPFEKPITLAVSTKVTFEVPVLELPKERTVVKRVGSTRRTLGKLMTSGGVGVVVAASGLALYAKRDYDKQFAGAMPHCSDDNPIMGMAVCDEAGQTRTERARNLTFGASIIGTVGFAAAAAGLVLWISAPRERAMTPIVTRNGVAIGGRF